MVVGLTGQIGQPVTKAAAVVHNKGPGLVPSLLRPTVVNLALEASRNFVHATQITAVSIDAYLTLKFASTL